MKHSKKTPLWYNPSAKDTRRRPNEDGMSHMAANREGRALLESYWRLYRNKL